MDERGCIAAVLNEEEACLRTECLVVRRGTPAGYLDEEEACLRNAWLSEGVHLWGT